MSIATVGYVKKFPQIGEFPITAHFVEKFAGEVPEGWEALVGREEALNAFAGNDDEIQQILGKALGYPWYKDDQKNFEGATEKEGVCVGDNVGVSLAQQAAAQISTLQMTVKLYENTAILFATQAATDIAQACRERDGWMETAAMMHRGQKFYHSLIVRCGKALGKESYISDDGSVQSDVLALRVPELVEAMCKPKNRFLRALSILLTGK